MSSGSAQSPRESLSTTGYVGEQSTFPMDSDDENSQSTRSGSLGSETSPHETDASDSDEHGQDLLGQAPQPGRRGVISSPGLSQISQISRERSRARRLRAGEPAGRAHGLGDGEIALRQRSPPSEDERSHTASTRTLQATHATGGSSVYSVRTPGSVAETEEQGSPASTRTLQGRTPERGGSVHDTPTHRSNAPTPHSSGERGSTVSTRTLQERRISPTRSSHNATMSPEDWPTPGYVGPTPDYEPSSSPLPRVVSPPYWEASTPGYVVPTPEHEPYASPPPQVTSPPYMDAPTPRPVGPTPTPVSSPSSFGFPSREHLLYGRNSVDTESLRRPTLYDEESDAVSEATTVRLSQEHDITGPGSRLPSVTPGLTEGGSASPSSTIEGSEYGPGGAPVDYRSARPGTGSDAGGSISPIHTRRRDQLEDVHVRSDHDRDTEDDSDETEGA